MAQVFNPWTDPPKLTGDLASFEMSEGADDAAEASHEDHMTKALQVISQQAELIAKLMASIGTGNDNEQPPG